MTLKEHAKQLKQQLPALYLAFKNPKTPAAAKILAAVTVCSALSPIDLIPDFIPVLGYLDDLLILPCLAALTIHLIPKDIMEQCRKESADLWKNGRPKKWFYGLPVLALWVLVLIWIIRLIV